MNIGTGGVNINQLNPSYFSMGSSLLDSVDNPFYGKGGTGTIGTAKVPRNQLLRPHPQFSAVTLLQSGDNTAKYDSLVLRLQKKIPTYGLFFTAFYTWSKNLDGSFGTGNQITGQAGVAQNAYDLGAEYGLAISDIPHRFSTAVTYDLPFGKGRPWLNGNRWLNAVVGGWQLNSILLLQKGFPLAIRQSQNLNSSIGASVQRPNATGVSPVVSGSISDRLDGYSDTTAFSTAIQFTFGNLSRTISYRAPGVANVDLSLFKSFPIRERVNCQFRAEAMNAFNSPQFGPPNLLWGSATFGMISSQLNLPRYFQFGLRVQF